MAIFVRQLDELMSATLEPIEIRRAGILRVVEQECGYYADIAYIGEDTLADLAEEVCEYELCRDADGGCSNCATVGRCELTLRIWPAEGIKVR